MARQHGPLQLTGSLGNLSFYYHKEYGYLARQKGGARPGKLSPRTQENGDELGAGSRTGKLLRMGIRSALHLQGDSMVSQRLTGCLSRVLQLDGVSERGKRTVANGLQTEEGRRLLCAFAFVKDQPLEQVLHAVPERGDNGSLVLKGFVPERDLSYPSGATHAALQAAVIAADAGNDRYNAFASETKVAAIGNGAEDIVFEIAQLPTLPVTGGEFSVWVLNVVFLRETNGEPEVVKGGRFGIVGVV